MTDLSPPGRRFKRDPPLGSP